MKNVDNEVKLTVLVVFCVCSGEALQAHRSRPPAAGMLQSLSAAGEGGPRQHAWTYQPFGGRQAESPPHQQEWVNKGANADSSEDKAEQARQFNLSVSASSRLQTRCVEGFSAGCAALRTTPRATYYLWEPT